MSIVRINKEDKYFSASNEPFNDDRLMWETRGLIGYLLSKPNHWTIRIDDLLKRGPGGRDKVRKMLRDAQTHGYLNRQRITKTDGTFDWLWDIYESPSINPAIQTSGGFSVTGQPVADLPQVAKPVTGKPADIVITDKAITEQQPEGTTRKNAWQLYEQEIGALTPLIADDVAAWIKDTSEAWVKDAIREAAANNKRSWKYCAAILKRWQAQGSQKADKPKAAKRIPAETPLEKFRREKGYA